MKKYILLAFLASVFTWSCSNDDDGAAEKPTVVGTWTLESMNPSVIDMSCPEDPEITFNSNGTTTWVTYDSEDNCAASTSSGTWQKVEGDLYSVTIPGYGEVEGTVSFSGQDRFSFTTQVQFDGQSFPVVLNFRR